MIAVIDYGMGNLCSVAKAIEIMGSDVIVTNSPEVIEKADAIVLPGVGAFYYGMENLKKLGLIHIIHQAIEKNKPFLGICLGLQLLFTSSEEHRLTSGLNIIKGKVKQFHDNLKIPHMGWNQIKIKKDAKILDGIEDNTYFYFVHSYYVEPEDKDIIVATTDYGQEFVSVINKNNLWAIQFHPEKSEKSGLKILKNFLC